MFKRKDQRRKVGAKELSLIIRDRTGFNGDDIHSILTTMQDVILEILKKDEMVYFKKIGTLKRVVRNMRNGLGADGPHAYVCFKSVHSANININSNEQSKAAK